MNKKLQVIQLDVSELAAPEPMRQVLLALATLSQGQCLVIHHRKNPVPLYPKLIELGFAYRVDVDSRVDVDNYMPQQTTLTENNTSIENHVNDTCEDLAVVISVAWKIDELALGSLTEV